MLRTFIKIAGATLAFSLIHSFFASARVKEEVQRHVGERNCNGLYRVFYMGQSVVTLLALIVYTRKQPNKTLYVVRGRPAELMRAGQLYGLLALLHTVHQIGIAQFSGLSNLWAGLRGKKEIAPEPEGQGPAQGDNGAMRASGWFRVCRHPLNLLALPILWLQPRMTTRWASFSVVAMLYFFSGLFTRRRACASAIAAPTANTSAAGRVSTCRISAAIRQRTTIDRYLTGLSHAIPVHQAIGCWHIPCG